MLSYIKRDSKLSGILHVLLHMAEVDDPITSEKMAQVMQTNPVVIRRILAGLREQGLVVSEKGHGGGWKLSCDLNTVTLYDIYLALDCPNTMAMGNRSESPECLVEQAVNTVMNQACRDAEALLLARFKEVTLAMLNQQLQTQRRGLSLCPGQDQTSIDVHSLESTLPLTKKSKQQQRSR